MMTDVYLAALPIGVIHAEIVLNNENIKLKQQLPQLKIVA